MSKIDLTKIDGIQIISFLKEKGYDCKYTDEHIVEYKTYQLYFEFKDDYDIIIYDNFIYINEDISKKFSIQVQLDEPLDDSEVQDEIEELVCEFIKTLEFKDINYKEKLDSLKRDIYLSLPEISIPSDIDNIIKNLEELKTYYTKCYSMNKK